MLARAKRPLTAVTAIVALLTSHGPSATAADFYAGKQIILIVGSAPGGGYDLQARLMARHIGRHIPGNPVIVVQNMPAAGSIAAANHLFRLAAGDGTVIGAVQRGVLLAPINNPQGVQYDLARFKWIGSLNSETGVVFATDAAPVKTTRDLFEKELIVGANNNVDPELSARIYNALIGTRFRIVTGYNGTSAITLAMERGEVQGIADWSWSSVKVQKPDWLKSGKVIALLQGALQRDRELPDLPSALDFVKPGVDRRALQLYFTQKTVARPVLAPPAVPEDRLRVLRSAFDALSSDRDFLADAERLKIEVGPVSGPAVDEAVSLLTTAPREVVDRYKAAISGGAAK